MERYYDPKGRILNRSLGKQKSLDSKYLIVVWYTRSTPKLGVACTNSCRSRATQVLRREISCCRRRPVREAHAQSAQSAQRVGITGKHK